MCLLQISVTLREWDIPYNELKIGDKIGVGRFGIVYKWVTYSLFIVRIFIRQRSCSSFLVSLWERFGPQDAPLLTDGSGSISGNEMSTSVETHKDVWLVLCLSGIMIYLMLLWLFSCHITYAFFFHFETCYKHHSTNITHCFLIMSLG